MPVDICYRTGKLFVTIKILMVKYITLKNQQEQIIQPVIREHSCPVGIAFMYIETSSNNNGENVFCSLERIVIIQITNITFYFNRFSILTNVSLEAMGRFRVQLLLEDNTWNTQSSTTSNDWTLLNLHFTVENYGINLINDHIETAHADMCFSNITITHSVY